MGNIRLHLGSHKTATTYIQHVLGGVRPQMVSAGQFYLLMEETRALLTGKINLAEHASNAGFRGFYTQRRALAELRRTAGRYDNIAHDLVLSDENLLGEPCSSLDGRLYPNAAVRLSRLRDALPGKVGEVYLCIRDYAPFLASLHAEAIRWGTDVKPETLVAAYGQPKMHWSGLIAALRSVWPDARLTIWPFEEFSALRMQVLTMISRLSEDAVAALPDVIMRRGISQAGIEAALKAFETTRDRMVRQSAVLGAEAAHPRQTPADQYDPWPADLREAMSALYRRELGELRNFKDINLLSATPVMQA